METRNTILILSRSEDVRKDLSLRLELLGHRVEEASAPAEAAERMKSTPVHLVVSDWENAWEGKGEDWWQWLEPNRRPLVFFVEGDAGRVPAAAASAARFVLTWKNRSELMKRIQEILAAIPPQMRSRSSSAKDILVIEDSASIRGFIRRSLEKALPGCILREAEDGRQALSEMSRRRVDLIVTDLNMPGMDGRTFLKLLQGNPVLCRKPVIVLSGNITDDLRMLFRDTPNVRLLSKPATGSQIALLVVSLFMNEKAASTAAAGA